MTLAAQIAGTQAASLKGYWKCDETSGTTLADSSGNANDLTTTGSPTLGVAGQVGNAIMLNGTSQYASRTSSVIGNTPSAFTIIALVKGVEAQNAARLVSFGRSTSNNPTISLQTGAAIGPTFRGFWRDDASATKILTKHCGIGLHDEWRMIAIQVDATTCALWQDDHKLSTTSYTSAATTLNRTAIGALLRASASNFFAGSIQHVAVWTAKLTDTEITDIFGQTGITPLTSGVYSLSVNNRSSASVGEIYGAQGVAYDGSSIYFFCSGSVADGSNKIYRYTRSGNVYTLQSSRDIRTDFPAGATQANGLNYFNGSLWVGCNNYSTTPKLGWILEYNPTTLALIATNSVGANWCEGGAWKDVGSGNEFWAIYHDTPTVRRYDSSFALVGSYSLPRYAESDTSIVNERGLYQGAAWRGNDLFVQTHRVNPDARTDIYTWNGSGFDAKQILYALDEGDGQGISFEDSGVLLFAERDQGGDTSKQMILRATLTETVAGTHTATASLSKASATIAASLTHTPPVFSIAAALTGRTGLLAASGSAATATFTATAALSGKTALLASTLTFVVPVYTSTATLIGLTGQVSANATFSPGTFTATASLIGVTGDLSASVTFSAGTHTANVILVSAGPSLVASASFSPGTHIATAALSGSAGTIAASLTSTAPVYTATAALSSSSAVLSATMIFATQVYSASVALIGQTGIIAASGTTTTPTFAVTVSLTGRSLLLSAAGTVVNPTYTVTASLNGATGSLTAALSGASPSFGATGNLQARTGQISAIVTAAVPTYTIDASLLARTGLIDAVLDTTNPVYSAIASLNANSVQLNADLTAGLSGTYTVVATLIGKTALLRAFVGKRFPEGTVFTFEARVNSKFEAERDSKFESEPRRTKFEYNPSSLVLA